MKNRKYYCRNSSKVQ